MNRSTETVDSNRRRHYFEGMTTSDFLVEPSRSPKPGSVRENDRVRLVSDLSDDDRTYRAGSTGTVVHVYQDGAAYEVEITTPVHGVVTVEEKAIEAIAR